MVQKYQMISFHSAFVNSNIIINVMRAHYLRIIPINIPNYSHHHNIVNAMNRSKIRARNSIASIKPIPSLILQYFFLPRQLVFLNIIINIADLFNASDNLINNHFA